MHCLQRGSRTLQWASLQASVGRRSRVVTVRPVKPAGSTPNARANDGCFDLPDILVGDYSVRNALTSELVLIAKEAAAQGGYAFAVSTRDNDYDTLAKQDTATGWITFGAETSVDLPIAPNPGIIIAPLDPFTSELLDEEGPLGTVHTNGRSVEGAYLQDMDGDQFLDVVMFLEDGGNFILTGPLHPGASFDLPMQ